MPVRSELIIAGVALVLGFGLGWTIQEWRHDARYARLEASHAAVLEQHAYAVVESVEAARNLERRHMAALEKERDIAQKLAASARADADSRTVSLHRLRNRVDTLLANATHRDPTLTNGGPTAGASIDMLAHVLGRALDVAGQLAEYADEARIAGLTCERSYDGVRSAQ